MEWNEYLSKLINEDNTFDGITLSLDGDSTETDIPPIVKASVSMMDKMLERQGKLHIIVFPEKIQSAFIFSLAYLIHNITEGKIEKVYDPHSFVPGEKLRIGTAIAEFEGIVYERREERIKIRLAQGMKVSVPISEAPIFQKTDTGKKLSPYKTYDREKKKILEQQKGSRKGNSVLTYLAEYKTHMTSSIYSVTPVTPVKDQISECYMCGKKITQILMLSTVDYEGKMQSLGKGQAAGIPAMVYASDLYAVNTALETNPLPQSVLIDVSNTNSISGQLDELDKLIRHNIPIICITDTMNSFELDMLKTRGFDIWRWDSSSITNNLYDASNLSMDRKVKYCVKQTINYIKADGKEISVAIQKISAHRRETQNLSAQIMKVYSKLYNLSFAALQSIVPFDEMQIELASKSLEECERLLVEEKPYISEELYRDYYDATNALKKVYSDGYRLLKISALLNLLEDNKYKNICIIVPERANKKSVANLWNQWSLKTESHINITVLFPGEYYAAINSHYDFALVVGWLKRAIMRKILYSFNTKQYYVLLYDYEGRWQKYAVGKWSNSLRLSDNKDIIKKAFSSKDFIISSSRYQETEQEPVVIPESGEDEQEDIDLVLRENTFRRYTNGSTSIDTVEAIPVSYVGGYVAFYRTGHKLISATSIITYKGDNIKTLLPAELKTGDFVVVRETDKDIIREMADNILEKSGKANLRSLAEKWKEVLEIEMLFSTMEDFYQKMQDVGCTKGFPTVKRWIEDEDIIAPQQKQDLQYIAEVTQSELLIEMIDQIYGAAQEVKTAHSKAGRVLSQQLQKNLAEELKNYGEIDPFNFWEPIEIEIDGIGTIKVLKIIDIGQAVMVDASDTNHLIDE